MDKDFNKLVYGYKKSIWRDVKVQKKTGAPVMNLSKSKLKEPTYIDK